MVATWTPPEFVGYILAVVGWTMTLYMLESFRLYAKMLDNKFFLAVVLVESVMLLTLPLPTLSIRFYDFLYSALYLVSIPVPVLFFLRSLRELVSQPFREPKMEKHFLWLFSKVSYPFRPRDIYF